MIRYANVNGTPKEPSPGQQGVGPGCGTPMTAKCGPVKIHHWAHFKRRDCDPWWEPMTQWHLGWQNMFPPEWREKILREELTGEFHRADIHTPQGLTIEFQYSALSLNELQSRNTFYKKLIWVVNAQLFKKNISFSATPNPASPLLTDYHFIVDQYGLARFPQFYLKEEYYNYGPALSKIYAIYDRLAEVRKNDKYQYRLFTWQNKRQAWLNSVAPVLLDFGDDFLYWIRKREQYKAPLIYLQIVAKEEFLAKYTMA